MTGLNKQYHIIEVDKLGRAVLWVKTLTLRAAYNQLETLKARFKEKNFVLEVK